jgi:hypothetical protein
MREPFRLGCALGVAWGLLASAHTTAAAADGRAALQAACWQPSALSARPGEHIAVRLQRPAAMRIPSDGSDLKREIVAPVAAYAILRSELRDAQCARSYAAAFSSIPERPTLFRFPFGACNAAGLQAVADAGLLAIQWDVATGDPSPNRSARSIAEAIVRNARPGSIVVMHANGRGYHTAEALPLAVPALRAKGFKFVTVSELLAAGRPVVADTCYDSHPGDTDKYDFLLGRRPAASSWEPSPSNVRAAPAVPH